MENHQAFESTDTYFALFFFFLPIRILNIMYDILGINTLFILSHNVLVNHIMNKLLSPLLFDRCKNLV